MHLPTFPRSMAAVRHVQTAFGGYDLVMKAYHEAIKEGYRFGAYGDAMLILD